MPEEQFNEKGLSYEKCTGDPAHYDFDAITPVYFVEESQYQLESICGQDQRAKVTGTTTLPYKAICKLYMKSKTGHNLIGTGWLTDRNKVYTAGHCVFDSKYGGWMDSIIVIPGMAGTVEPYGRYVSEDMSATNGWIKNRSRRYDMGAIKLSAQVSHSDVLTPTLADSAEGTVCGYPGDRDRSIFQYKMRDAVSKRNGRFFYQIDTFGGQSGSPLLRDNHRAIGIHNYGGCDNKASDLYQEFIDGVARW